MFKLHTTKAIVHIKDLCFLKQFQKIKKKKFLYIKKLFTVESYHYYLKWGDLVWEMWKAEITLY